MRLWISLGDQGSVPPPEVTSAIGQSGNGQSASSIPPFWPPSCPPSPGGGAAAWIRATVSRPPVTRAWPDPGSTVTAQVAPPIAQEKRTPPRSTDRPAATLKLPLATEWPCGSVTLAG